MVRYIANPTGNLCSYSIGPYDGHGGHAEEHRQEMREIAEEMIQKMVPKMCADIYNEAVTNLIGAIQYDVETCVSVSIDSVGEILNKSVVKKVVTQNIMNELMAKIDKSVFKINL